MGTENTPALPRFCREGAIAHLDAKLGHPDAPTALALFDAACPTEPAACEDATMLLLNKNTDAYDPVAGADRLQRSCDAEASNLLSISARPLLAELVNCSRIVSLSLNRTDIPAVLVLHAQLAICKVETLRGVQSEACAALGSALIAVGQVGWVPPISNGVTERCLLHDSTICAVAGAVAIETEPEQALQLFMHGCVKGDAPACAYIVSWWTHPPNTSFDIIEQVATRLREACAANILTACAASLRFDTQGLPSSLPLLNEPALWPTADKLCSIGDAQACAALAFARDGTGMEGASDWARACVAGCVEACETTHTQNTCFTYKNTKTLPSVINVSSKGEAKTPTTME